MNGSPYEVGGALKLRQTLPGLVWESEANLFSYYVTSALRY